MSSQDPEIIVFACEWTPSTGADNAGVEMHPYSPFIRIIRIVCAGQINPANILAAFKNGADGVMIAGCAEGDCHYLRGNERCMQVVEETQELLDCSGINPERLYFRLFTEEEGSYFASSINRYAIKIKKMGKI